MAYDPRLLLYHANRWQEAAGHGPVEKLEQTLKDLEKEGITLSEYADRGFRFIVFKHAGQAIECFHPHDWLPEIYNQEEKESLKNYLHSQE